MNDWSNDQFVVDTSSTFRDVNTAAMMPPGPLVPHNVHSYENQYLLEQQGRPAYYDLCGCRHCRAVRSNLPDGPATHSSLYSPPMHTQTVDERYRQMYNADIARMRQCRAAGAQQRAKYGGSGMLSVPTYDMMIEPLNSSVLCMLTFVFIIVIIVACLCTRTMTELSARLRSLEGPAGGRPATAAPMPTTA